MTDASKNQALQILLYTKKACIPSIFRLHFKPMRESEACKNCMILVCQCHKNGSEQETRGYVFIFVCLHCNKTENSKKVPYIFLRTTTGKYSQSNAQAR